ncbi:peptidoglycan editing factor PgeF [Novosphingobium flavum]|uniref:Purine nucleoside phosphorylase n=1 Tax=Novosphingobium flavum TaxID=1778672 RepID=A0A7X1KKY1_9SPHN|nr:peptidoglycan editing factor PgeF [Novosphingobium flavum]MBC2664665.1 peptidoglycan editing factor PgeF [Novosphingobium flavum]
MADAPEVLTAKALAGTRHGFLGRTGGVSTGVVAGLNVGLGAGDDGAAVAENRRRAVDAVAPGARLVTVYQIHSPTCVTVADPWDETSRPEADALVTDRPGLVLGIVTADCAPILFADVAAGVIGAAHAGWKGAFTGVAESTVAAMEALGARRERIAAAIGPCISQASYEVDEGFRARFIEQSPESERFFAPGRPGHCHFALESYVADRLARAGVATIAPLAADTCSQPARFYSYRRSTLAGEPAYGRQFSLIALG